MASGMPHHAPPALPGQAPPLTCGKEVCEDGQHQADHGGGWGGPGGEGAGPSLKDLWARALQSLSPGPASVYWSTRCPAQHRHLPSLVVRYPRNETTTQAISCVYFQTEEPARGRLKMTASSPISHWQVCQGCRVSNSPPNGGVWYSQGYLSIK